MIGLVVAGVVAVVVVVVALVAGKSVVAAIETGSGTATVTWTPAHPSDATTSFTPQAFSGSINGNSLTGVATSPLASSSASSDPFSPGSTAKAELFRYRGTYDGKPYTIGIFLQGPLTGTNPSVQFTVSGTYGGQPVHGVVGPAPANSTSATVPFHGTIGEWKVTGTLGGPTGTAQQQTATAHFTVSR